MKYLKIEAEAVYEALAALNGAHLDEKIREEFGHSWPERVEHFKSQYDMFKAAVMAAEIIEEEEDETV